MIRSPRSRTSHRATARSTLRLALEQLEDRIAPALVPIGAPLNVNGTIFGGDTLASNHSVAAASNGNFVVVEDNGGGVSARLFHASGAPITNLLSVGANTAGTTNGQATVAMNDAGQFVVAWVESSGSVDGVAAQLFSATGVAGQRFLVNSSAQFAGPTVGIDRAGDFVVAYTHLGGTAAAPASTIDLFEHLHTGVISRPSTIVNPAQLLAADQPNDRSEPSIAMNSSGAFALVFQAGDITNRSVIIGQRFAPTTATGQLVYAGNEFLVSSQVDNWLNPGNTNADTQPSVAINATGAMIVGYARITGTTLVDVGIGAPATEYLSEVLVAHYNAGGQYFTGEYANFASATNVASSPSVAIDSSGNSVVVFMTGGDLGGAPNPDAKPSTIYGCTYGSDGLEQLPPYSYVSGNPNPVAGDVDSNPSVAAVQSGTVIAAWQNYGTKLGPENLGTTGVYANVYNSAPFTFQVNPNGATPFPLVEGLPTQVPVTVSWGPGFTGPVTIQGIGLPSGITVTPGTPSTNLFGETLSLTVTAALNTYVPDVQGQNNNPYRTITISASSPGSPTETATLQVQLIPYQVHSVTPLTVYEPEFMQPGTTVTIVGSGFVPGMQVQIGDNQSITVDPQNNGTVLQVQVPFGANDQGPKEELRVSQPGGLTQPGGLNPIDAGTLNVLSYRSLNGFSFPNNFTNDYSFGVIQGAFGYAQTHVSTPKVLGFQLSAPIPSPDALAFMAAFNAALGGIGDCYGMDLASLQFINHVVPINADFGLPPDKPPTVYNLQNNGNLMNYIEEEHVIQFSQQGLGQAADWEAKFALGQLSAASVYNQLQGILQSGQTAIIGLEEGIGKGHALAAYDLQPDTDPNDPGGFYIDVYDPDKPFAGKNPKGQFWPDADSAILVTNSGHWTYWYTDSLDGHWAGDLSGLVVFPYTEVPANPTLPTGSLLTDLAAALLFAGSPGTGAGALTGPVTLNPVTLNQGGALTIDGFYQPAGTNNAVTIGTTATGGVRLTLNNQTYSYARGQVTSITYVGADGNETINVEAVPAKVDTQIYLSTGTDTVNISPTAHNLGNIAGTVEVYGNSGVDTLNINDQAGAVNSTYDLTAASLTRIVATTLLPRIPPPNISFQAINNVTLNGGNGAFYKVQGTGASATVLNLAGTASSVDVQATTGPLTINGKVATSLTIGDGPQELGAIAGPISFNGARAANSISLMDQAANTSENYLLMTTVQQHGPATPVTLFQRGAGPPLTFTNPGTITLATGSAGATVVVSGAAGPAISLVGAGTATQDTLVGPEHANAWLITDPNAGTLDSTIQFQDFGNLQGGASGDAFAMGGVVTRNGQTVHQGGSLTGTLDGGAGSNTLDYSAYIGNVTVDLPLDSATRLGAVRNIQNVVGSQGNDILVGTAGTASLKGGTGRNLLIAGVTPATLIGNAGQDILVGGTTNYDLNPAVLAAIFAIWTRTDLGSPNDPTGYQARVNELVQGGGGNSNHPLNRSTFHSNGGANTLTGGAGLDLFYGSKTRDSNDWNASQGEVFIEGLTAQNTQIDARGLTVQTLTLDGAALTTSAVASLMLAAGPHTLADPRTPAASISFYVAADGTVDYDPSLNNVLGGRGTTTLLVKGVTVTIDATRLSTPYVDVDGGTVGVGNAAPLAFTALPGTYSLSDFEATGTAVQFTIGASGTVSYDPSLEGLLTGSNTNTLVVHGTTVTIDATRLTTAYVLLDGGTVGVQNTAPRAFTALPGTYSLFGHDATGTTVPFTINAYGTVSYEPALEGILRGTGTSTLTVAGVTVTIDATRLTTEGVQVDDANTTVPNTAPLAFTALPGTYSLLDVHATGTTVPFTINANGTVSYEPALEGILKGTGTSTLTVAGVAVTIDATRLTTAYVLLDGGAIAVPSAAPLAFTALPGTYALYNPNDPGTTLLFTINANGTVGYDRALQGILTGAGTATLTVVGVVLNIDATALSPQTPSFSVAGVSFATAQVQTLYVLPGTLALQAGALSTTFTLSAMDQLDYDASLNNQLSGRATNTLVVNATA